MIKVARLLLSTLGCLSVVLAAGQPGSARAQSTYDSALLNKLDFRNIGPFHGGRATTAVGVPGNNQLYYMGATGGGVWKSADGGQTWDNVSDGFFDTGSIGDIAVANSNPNVIYVGTGEAPVRGQMSSYGDGVYKSIDAGKTWKHVGLDKTMQISRVVVSPTNPDIVYVAAQGNRWKPSEDRGVYKSTDGGTTWKRILFSSDLAGASELQMDPYDPNVLYAAFWDFQRFPWMIRSGGPGSGIWKTTDGGEHWMQLRAGLPKVMGKIRLSVSAANDNRIYAGIESEKSGLFRSDDAGQNWKQVNAGAGFATRPWYYLGVAADPKNVDTLYVSGAWILKSTDGGKTFAVVKTHHGDTHTLWISPTDPQNMVETDDGGAEVSFTGGRAWTDIDNQPTAQFYTVHADDLFPYNLYSGQQDTTAVKVASRTFGSGESDVVEPNWRPIAVIESARPSFDPKDPRFVLTSGYEGTAVLTDMQTHVAHDVSPWPGQKLGFDAAQMTYRFDWSPPTLRSRLEPNTIYLGGNVLFRTRDQGLTWDVVSPDLTRDEKDKHGRSGLWWHDGSGGEVYNAIFAVAESGFEPGVIWVGTDDGLVQLTRDGGKSWTNVTPPAWQPGWVYTIEPSPFEKGTAYVAVSRHRTGDMKPYLYRTTDFGRTWTDLASTLPQDAPARVLRADPVRKGLLYAATEYRMWISFDDGAHWQAFQQNLPHVPFSDLEVHDSDLLVATEGRGFWILDDLTTLRQMTPEAATAAVTLFKPRDTLRIPGGQRPSDPKKGFRAPTNPPDGVIIRYALAQAIPVAQAAPAAPAMPTTPTTPAAPALKLDILDATGAVVRSYTPAPPRPAQPPAAVKGASPANCDAPASPDPQPAAPAAAKPDKDAAKPDKDEVKSDKPGDSAGHCARHEPVPVSLDANRGLNQLVWNLRSSPVPGAKGDGPMAPRGRYVARLTLGATIVSQTFDVVADPRVHSTPEQDRERFALTRHIMEVITATDATHNELLDVLKQAHDLQKQAKNASSKAGEAALETFIADMEKVEHRFDPPAPKGPAGQMVLDTGSAPVGQFGPVENAIDNGEGPIAQGDRLRAREVEALCDQVRAEAEAAMNADIPRIDARLVAAGLSPTVVRHPGVSAPPGDPGDDQDDEEGADTDY